MNFAEKTLLLSLVRQTGQLYFTTGLKLDLVVISCGNTDENYIFSLSEGHWPGGKSANETISMLYYTLVQIKNQYGKSFRRKLVIHCDNCAGQNRNRFVIWFCSSIVSIDMFDQVELDLLIAGHTKNECDDAFGCTKKKLRRTDVAIPRKMQDLINSSSKTAKAVAPGKVQWILRKTFLSERFYIPSTLKINSYHQFRFSKTNSEQSEALLHARELSTSTIWKTFKLSKNGAGRSKFPIVGSKEFAKSYLTNVAQLSDILVGKNLSRRGYLQKNICKKYYEHDSSFEKEFFKE